MLSPNDSSKRNYGNPHAIFQNANVPAATMAILMFFVNGLVMEMCRKSIFQNANVPAATIAILTDFFQCSGYAECV